MYLSVVNTDFFWIGRNGKEQTPTKTDTWQTIRSTNETVIWYLNVSHVTSKINSNSHHKKATRITISNNNNNNNGETAKYQKKRSITSTWYYTSKNRMSKTTDCFIVIGKTVTLSTAKNVTECHLKCWYARFSASQDWHNHTALSYHQYECCHCHHLNLPSPHTLHPISPHPAFIAINVLHIPECVLAVEQLCAAAAASKQLLIFMHSPHISFDNSIRRQIHDTPGTLYHPAHTRSAIWSG